MYLNYKEIQNERQEMLVEVCFECGMLWSKEKWDKYDTLAFIDRRFDRMLNDYHNSQGYKDETAPFSEYIVEWYSIEFVCMGIHHMYDDVTTWKKKFKPLHIKMTDKELREYQLKRRKEENIRI